MSNTIKHCPSDESLGSSYANICVQCNYAPLDKIHFYYCRLDNAYKLMNEYTVAIFKIKKKKNANTTTDTL
jgi:hypothetical protein